MIRINGEPKEMEPVRVTRPRDFKHTQRKKRKTRRFNKICESDSEESSIKLSSEEESEVSEGIEITEVKPIAFSRPKRACILRSAARSDVKSIAKSDSSLMKRGPGRPKKKTSCQNLNPEIEIPCEPEIKDQEMKSEKKSNESMDTITEDVDQVQNEELKCEEKIEKSETSSFEVF